MWKTCIFAENQRKALQKLWFRLLQLVGRRMEGPSHLQPEKVHEKKKSMISWRSWFWLVKHSIWEISASKKQENLHFFNIFIQKTIKGAGFLAFLILKSPECCVLQCKINFFMKSFIFFFFTELSPAGTPSPLLTSHRPDDGKSLSTCALLIT